METQQKKATVTKAEFKNTYSGTNGDIHYHTIEFSNGDKGSYGSKHKEQAKFSVGKEVDYDWIKDDNGYIKIKPIQQGGGLRPGGMAAPVNETAANARAALNTAALMIVGGKAPDGMSLSDMANKLFVWLENKSK